MTDVPSVNLHISICSYLKMDIIYVCIWSKNTAIYVLCIYACMYIYACIVCICMCMHVHFISTCSNTNIYVYTYIIGGQSGVNLCKPCKLFFTRKSDFNRLIQEYGGRNKPMKIGCVTRGFCKTLRNHRDSGVCIWSGKVYTWLNLVCSGHFTGIVWFTHCLHIVKIVV
jgi:hypothetical protein